MIEHLSLLDVKIEVRQCDVGNEADVQKLVSHCSQMMPPIRGVLHGTFVSKVSKHSFHIRFRRE